jgi:hypothetical protein
MPVFIPGEKTGKFTGMHIFTYYAFTSPAGNNTCFHQSFVDLGWHLAYNEISVNSMSQIC